ncbi:unnamed protein product [Pedinophyceae sp. YPF-701]|nr:unnamed protein product [Pedinophyceae sp. YPF-701]
MKRRLARKIWDKQLKDGEKLSLGATAQAGAQSAHTSRVVDPDPPLTPQYFFSDEFKEVMRKFRAQFREGVRHEVNFIIHARGFRGWFTRAFLLGTLGTAAFVFARVPIAYARGAGIIAQDDPHLPVRDPHRGMGRAEMLLSAPFHETWVREMCTRGRLFLTLIKLCGPDRAMDVRERACALLERLLEREDAMEIAARHKKDVGLLLAQRAEDCAADTEAGRAIGGRLSELASRVSARRSARLREEAEAGQPQQREGIA